MSYSNLTPEQVYEHIRHATVNAYDHGGARMYFEDVKGSRHLIADLYGDGPYRDFILSVLKRSFETPATLAGKGLVAQLEAKIAELEQQNKRLTIECNTHVSALRARQQSETPSAQPSAWLHTLHMELWQKEKQVTIKSDHPFGKPGRDFSEEYSVTSSPLYASPVPTEGTNK